MGEVIELRNVDPLRGGQVEMLVRLSGDATPRAEAIIQRGSANNPFLGPQGWQTVEYGFRPIDASRRDGMLVLRFGPELVDNALRDDDIIQINLPSLGLADVVTWSGITRSVTVGKVAGVDGPLGPPKGSVSIRAAAGNSGGFELVLVSEQPLPPQLTARITRDHAGSPALGPQGWQAAAAGLSPASSYDEDGARVFVFDRIAGAAPARNEPIKVEIPEADLRGKLLWPGIEMIVDPEPEPGETTVRPKWPLALAGLVVIAALAGGAWWWTQQQKPVPVPPPLPCGSEGAPACDAPPPPPDPVDAGRAAYDRAMAAIAANDCSTARTEMLSAIDHDYGPAFVAWGQGQDSLEFTPCLTETSNDISALDYFERACAADVEGAADSVEALQAELTRRADRGDAVAGEVLRLAIPKAREACGI